MRKVPLVMNARAVDDAAAHLRELRLEELEDLGLAALALGLAVAATQVRPSLAVPLFLGGLAVGVLGIRALWRRWDLVERLAGERDAYVISEVLAYASRETTIERRHSLAALIRSTLRQPGPVFETRVRAAREELDALASELDDGELELDPACAVACIRLLSDLAESPLLNPALPPEELRSRVRQIRSASGPAGLRPDRRERSVNVSQAIVLGRSPAAQRECAAKSCPVGRLSHLRLSLPVMLAGALVHD